MDILTAIILGIIQGVTEFLPISSSGHLSVSKQLLGSTLVGPSLFFDLILHLGTLVAILWFYWKDIVALFSKEKIKDIKLIVIACIPFFIIGFLFKKVLGYDDWSDDLYLIATCFISTGLILYISESISIKQENDKSINWWKSLIIGAVQGLAVLKGVSRSGSTISTGMLLGINKEKAARFSFFIFIPAVLGAFCYQILKYDEENCDYYEKYINTNLSLQSSEDIAKLNSIKILLRDEKFKEASISFQNFIKSKKMPDPVKLPLSPVIIGFVVSIIVGFMSLKLLIKIIECRKFRYFSYYLWCIGILIVVFKLIKQ